MGTDLWGGLGASYGKKRKCISQPCALPGRGKGAGVVVDATKSASRILGIYQCARGQVLVSLMESQQRLVEHRWATFALL